MILAIVGIVSFTGLVLGLRYMTKDAPGPEAGRAVPGAEAWAMTSFDVAQAKKVTAYTYDGDLILNLEQNRKVVIGRSGDAWSIYLSDGDKPGDTYAVVEVTDKGALSILLDGNHPYKQ